MRRYIVVMIYPMTLEPRILDEVFAETKEDAKARIELLYPKWKITAVKEVIEDDDGEED